VPRLRAPIGANGRSDQSAEAASPNFMADLE
jgi:hypothetical protein